MAGGKPVGPWTRETLLKAAGGDAELGDQLAEIFLEDMPRMLAAVRSAAHAGDRDDLRSRAHSLKGASITLGFADVARAASVLEAAADDFGADPESRARGLDDLARACDDAQRALHVYLSER